MPATCVTGRPHTRPVSETADLRHWPAHERLCSCANPHERAVRHGRSCPVFAFWSERRTDPDGWLVLRLEEAASSGANPHMLLERYRTLAANLLIERAEARGRPTTAN